MVILFYWRLKDWRFASPEIHRTRPVNLFVSSTHSVTKFKWNHKEHNASDKYLTGRGVSHQAELASEVGHHEGLIWQKCREEDWWLLSMWLKNKEGGADGWRMGGRGKRTALLDNSMDEVKPELCLGGLRATVDTHEKSVSFCELVFGLP